MAASKDQIDEETVRFHRVVAEGSLEELRDLLDRGVKVDVPGHAGQTALMLAFESKDLEKSKLLIQHGADPELTDDFNDTALRHAVEADFADGVRLLLSLNVDRGYQPRYPLKKVEYETLLPEPEMPEEMKGILSEAEWKESWEQTKASMREWGQNPEVQPMICSVGSLEVLKLFLEAGDDLNQAPTERKRELVGLGSERELRVSPEEYQRHKSPRFGSQNPERMDYPFWREMIKSGVNAYAARVQYQDKDPFTKPGVVWCYERFGSTLTPLADGRFVQIGGEHEDYYDPDFFIYNDVVIYDGKGEFQIYGYLRDVFPPTDFHTATLGRDGIYIVGCLGYPEQRRSEFTPVYRLSLDSWKIEPIETTGKMPGWISNHRARFDSQRNAIHVSGGQIHVNDDAEGTTSISNPHQYELDLNRLHWRRLD